MDPDIAFLNDHRCVCDTINYNGKVSFYCKLCRGIFEGSEAAWQKHILAINETHDDHLDSAISAIRSFGQAVVFTFRGETIVFREHERLVRANVRIEELEALEELPLPNIPIFPPMENNAEDANPAAEVDAVQAAVDALRDVAENVVEAAINNLLENAAETVHNATVTVQQEAAQALGQVEDQVQDAVLIIQNSAQISIENVEIEVLNLVGNITQQAVVNLENAAEDTVENIEITLNNFMEQRDRNIFKYFWGGVGFAVIFLSGVVWLLSTFGGVSFSFDATKVDKNTSILPVDFGGHIINGDDIVNWLKKDNNRYQEMWQDEVRKQAKLEAAFIALKASCKAQEGLNPNGSCILSDFQKECSQNVAILVDRIGNLTKSRTTLHKHVHMKAKQNVRGSRSFALRTRNSKLLKKNRVMKENLGQTEILMKQCVSEKETFVKEWRYGMSECLKIIQKGATPEAYLTLFSSLLNLVVNIHLHLTLRFG